jgi:DUF1680 family protein
LRKRIVLTSLLVAAMPFLPATGVSAPWTSNAEIPDKVPMKAIPFQLENVRLLDGPFRDAMLRDQKFLLGLEPDRLLHSFRITAGLPSIVKPYGGWEAPDIELRGHSLGHYLSACSLMYSSTGDERFRARTAEIVAELAKVQEAMPSRGFHAGYLSAFPEGFFDRVDARKRVWAPYYTLHKIMAGLLDTYTHCANQQALDVLQKLAAWVKFRVDRLSEDQQQRALDTEFGGMNEVLANLYGITGNEEYLRVAHRFDHKRIFDPLASGQDPLDGLHANTQIPKAIGAAREYELSGDRRYFTIASFFWERVAEHRSYVIGGNSDGESFFSVDHFSRHLGTSSTETCNTYNMLKLTRHLFEWSPSAQTMDFYERGLYNQILASQDPATGMMTYYVPLRPGAFKTFSTPEQSFWCCVGTGMENHAKYGDTIYFHDDASLYLNLFIPSELNWKDKGLRVRQETRFPEENTTRLSFKCDKPIQLALKIRYPAWAVSGFTVGINGKPQSLDPKDAKPGSYVTIDRQWRNGDTVQVKMPMSLHLEAMPDDPKMVALLYGPVVLAGELGKAGLDAARRYGPEAPQLGRVPKLEVPGFICNVSDLLARVKPVAGSSLTFRTDGIGRPNDVELVPFYKVFDERYSVYWKVYSESEWEARKAAIAAAEAHRAEIDRRTIDAVVIGNEQSERGHGFHGERTNSGYHEGRTWRDARDGWFSYDLKLAAGKEGRLLCTYWGGESRGRVFDILINGEKIATQELSDNKPGEFFEVEYPIQESLTAGKQRITVRFQAHPNATAGGIFDVRLVMP